MSSVCELRSQADLYWRLPPVGGRTKKLGKVGVRSLTVLGSGLNSDGRETVDLDFGGTGEI